MSSNDKPLHLRDINVLVSIGGKHYGIPVKHLFDIMLDDSHGGASVKKRLADLENIIAQEEPLNKV